MKIAHTDIQTGKIYGCEPGSKQWFHEEGHLMFNLQENSSILKLFQGYAFGFWMFSITLSVINKFMLFLSIPTLLFCIGVDLYEEWWCNIYANVNFNNNVHK